MASDKLPGVKTQSILEDYEVSWRQKLGTGISGPVRPCKNKKTGVRYALKCLTDKSRSRREIALHIKCAKHPHIVDILDIYANEVQFPGEQFPKARLLVVMELMEGGELFDRISQQKVFTENQAAKYTKQITLAIHGCHSLDIAHRDLKPENLLMKDNSEDAVVKLSDFGFAKVDEGNLVTPHFTPYYVAPQVLEAQRVQAKQRYCILPTGSPYTYDKSCDLWSLGVIVYIMLCGYPPFFSEAPGKQITKMMKKKIMSGDYEFPVEDWGLISHQAKHLVSSLLQVNPDDRLTVNDVLDHPWLVEAPLTELQSPAVMLNKNALFEANQAHSQALTSMRLPDQQIILKPLTDVNNPMLRKRVNSNASTSAPSKHGHSADEEEPATKLTPGMVYIQALRDIIAHCILPSGEQNVFEEKLCVLVNKACQHHQDTTQLQGALHRWRWDGRRFEERVDRQQLAQSLSEIVSLATNTPATDVGR